MYNNIGRYVLLSVDSYYHGQGESGMESKKYNRIGKTNINYQGCPMKIVEYNNSHNIIVEFQDDYKARVHTDYRHFETGTVRNPYYPTVHNIGITGNKYPTCKGKTTAKEFETWMDVIKRSFNDKTKERNPAYKDVNCCEEWLLYDNFHEWLHEQPNFDKWYSGKRWAIDKDILIKGNKVYSPETCCLVPHYVNTLFVKNDAIRGNLPIGVAKHGNKFKAYCINPFTGLQEYLGLHCTSLDAFYAYKKAKESFIKEMAEVEYNKGNITKECYEAMMSYEVEITD